MSLFDTLLSLCCEDIMLELLLKYLLPCRHIPVSYRHKINKIDPYFTAAQSFFDLSPEINKLMVHQQFQPISKTIGANWNHYGVHTGETLYSNYHAYLCDARHRICQCKNACDVWHNKYHYEKPPSSKKYERTMELIRNLFSELNDESNNGIPQTAMENIQEKGVKQFDSLQSLGESSGYESLRYRYEEDEEDDPSIGKNTFKTIDRDASNNFETVDTDGLTKQKHEVWKHSSRLPEPVIDKDFSEDLFTQGTVSLGKCDFHS